MAQDSLDDLREKPAGTVRITTHEHAARTVLWPALERLLPGYPEIKVEVAIDYGLTDIVAERCDAGIRSGETVAKDMISMRLGPDLRMAVVGAPSYFAERPCASISLSLRGAQRRGNPGGGEHRAGGPGLPRRNDGRGKGPLVLLQRQTRPRHVQAQSPDSFAWDGATPRAGAPAGFRIEPFTSRLRGHKPTLRLHGCCPPRSCCPARGQAFPAARP